VASVEVFCRNVKTILTQRSIRIKDLAERIGLSESYLSLVLNGTRKNLNDEYKDRIASCLNATLSQLYSDEFPSSIQKEDPIFLQDPDRRETTRLLDAFLSRTNLESDRTSFYSSLAILNDREARTIRLFLSSLLKGLSRADSSGNEAGQALLSLSEDERNLLAIYSIAGEGAKLEWVKAASDLSNESFSALTEKLRGKGLVALTEDRDGAQSHVIGGSLPVSSIFALRKLKEIHLTVARAMEAHSDEGPSYERSLAQHLVKAGRDAEALEHMKRAAGLFEASSLWDEAAQTWEQASVVCGILGSMVDRGGCLADAARCLCPAGQYEQAVELAGYACHLLEREGRSRAVGNISIMMGNMLWKYDIDAAIGWYRKGLTATPKETQEYGNLLINLASASFEAGKLDDAENSLKEASRWAAGRDPEEVRSINLHIALNLGLIEYQRRNWKKARSHFESCLGHAQESGERLDTVWHNLGMLMYRDDNMRAARDNLTKAQELYWERGYKQLWAYAAIELAKVALRTGDLDEALRQVTSAEPYLEEKSLRTKGWVLLLKGCVEHGQRHLNEAIDNSRKAIDAFQRMGEERDLACAALLLSSLFAEAGDVQQSKFMERRAYQIYEKRHWDIRELLRERSLLEPEVK
jgi:tetratricopeptide (TPR) repeat protein